MVQIHSLDGRNQLVPRIARFDERWRWIDDGKVEHGGAGWRRLSGHFFQQLLDGVGRYWHKEVVCGWKLKRNRPVEAWRRPTEAQQFSGDISDDSNRVMKIKSWTSQFYAQFWIWLNELGLIWVWKILGFLGTGIGEFSSIKSKRHGIFQNWLSGFDGLDETYNLIFWGDFPAPARGVPATAVIGQNVVLDALSPIMEKFTVFDARLLRYYIKQALRIILPE